jgi:hypothetical protein
MAPEKKVENSNKTGQVDEEAACREEGPVVINNRQHWGGN